MIRCCMQNARAARCHFQRSTLCRLATDSERFARRRCRAKAPNNDQAPSLANRLRSFANESAGCLLQMPDFFFSPIMCWFLFDGLEASCSRLRPGALHGSLQEKSSCSQLCLRAKTLNNHHAPSLAIVTSSGGCQIHLVDVKSCPSACSTGMRSTCICCKYFEPEQSFALEKMLSSFHIDTCAQALFQYKYWLHKKQILVKFVKCLAKFGSAGVHLLHPHWSKKCTSVANPGLPCNQIARRFPFLTCPSRRP